jgi:hypothetical protein
LSSSTRSRPTTDRTSPLTSVACPGQELAGLRGAAGPRFVTRYHPTRIREDGPPPKFNRTPASRPKRLLAQRCLRSATS